MLIPDECFSKHHPMHTTERLTRNHLEFAGVVIYLFVLAVAFTIVLTLMLFSNEGPARARNSGTIHVAASVSERT